jgi:hypothetical protein
MVNITFAQRRESSCMPKESCDESGLVRPAFVIRIEGLASTFSRELIESRFCDRQLRPAVHLNQTKRDQCRWFTGVIMVGIDGEGMPAKGKPSHGRQLFHKYLKWLPSVRFLKSRDFRIHLRRNYPSIHLNARDKRAVELNAEPCSEARRIADRLPCSLDGGSEENLFPDLVRIHDQSFICESACAERAC